MGIKKGKRLGKRRDPKVYNNYIVTYSDVNFKTKRPNNPEHISNILKNSKYGWLMKGKK